MSKQSIQGMAMQLHLCAGLTSALTWSKMGMSTLSNTRLQKDAAKVPPCALRVSNNTSNALLRIWSL